MAFTDDEEGTIIIVFGVDNLSVIREYKWDIVIFIFKDITKGISGLDI